MIDAILGCYISSDYDFRKYANRNDPLKYCFEEWVGYYRMKWSIARAINPKCILEIGVRFGYSARAFLDACPDATLLAVDTNRTGFHRYPGANDWAESSISSSGYHITILKEDTARLKRLPGEIYDLIHVDGQQDGDGIFHNLDLALPQSQYILVDGYHRTRDHFLAVNEWIWLNKAAVQSATIIPGYVGEMLIRSNVNSKTGACVNSPTSEPLSGTYTKDYYLTDCGGFSEWRQSKGQSIDPRLQAVAETVFALSSPRKVVDLGAGRGELTRLFAQRDANVTAIDYSKDACTLIYETLGDGTSSRKTVKVVCDSVLNIAAYDEHYDVAVASDIIEHLSPDENEQLYAIVSRKLRQSKGTFVIHTAPNQWCYRYEHPREQLHAKRAGFWLPRTRRTWFERLMHINEQNPKILRKQLQRHFPFVVVWLTDQSMGGSLLRRFRIEDFRKAASIFAVASHSPIDRERLVGAFSMQRLPETALQQILVRIRQFPDSAAPGQLFMVEVELSNGSNYSLSSQPPFPFHLSYHWLDESRNVHKFDGRRTTLTPHLGKQSTGVYRLRVEAPLQPGKYFFQAAPVQESVRWYLDSSPALPVIVTDQLGCC
jgi:predicted O-methyltransferase YrrM